MMKLPVAIAVLSVLFIGQQTLLAQDSETVKKPATEDVKKDESGQTDAAKQQFDDKMESRKAELKEMSGNDPEKKAEIKAQMEQEKKEYKEQVKAQEMEQKGQKKDAADNTGDEGYREGMNEKMSDDVGVKKDELRAKSGNDPASKDQIQSEIQSYKDGKKEGMKEAEKEKSPSKEGKSKEAKKAKPKAGKKDASE